MRVKITHITSWWDGPLSGYCDIGEKHCFFDCLGGDYTRTFCVYEITPEEYSVAQERYSDFVNLVYGGSYTEHIDEDGKYQDCSGNVVSDTMNDFYKKWSNITAYPKRQESFVGLFRLK